MSETRDCGGDAAAYALGALSPAEAEEFRRHLHSCVVCRDEVTAFREVTDTLAMAAPQHSVPRGLRRRVLRAVQAAPGPAAWPTPRHRQRRFSARLVPRPALAGALLAAAALALAGGLALAPEGSRGSRVTRAAVIGVPGRAQLRIAGAHAELVVSHLQPPRTGRIYELWIERGRQAPAPTRALFRVTGSGAAEVGVPGDVRGISTIMVTQEPVRGSLVPTGPTVIFARLT